MSAHDNGTERQQFTFLCKTVTGMTRGPIFRMPYKVILDTHEFDGVEQLLEILNELAVSAPHA